MRIAVHDYCGHPFQVQLSRELARRGHQVTHLWCPSVPSGRGGLEPRPGDPAGLSVVPVALDRAFERYQAWKRLPQEVAYGRRLVVAVEQSRPDVVISANTPLLAQRALVSACGRQGTPFVSWLQDLLSIGTGAVLRRRVPGAGALAGATLEAIEARMLRASDAVVAISADFRPTLDRFGVAPERVQVIENWAPLDELAPAPRHNAWSAQHGLDPATVLCYAGTLGLKHDPELLLALARHFRHQPGVRLVVVSEGRGRQWLGAKAAEEGLANVVLVDYQPYDRLAEVLGAADVLVCILNQEAGAFSVPSKVLTYHCAGRPLLAAIPAANLAARVVR
ncbi:MAG: glycosyltransferase family 4 protein, partial [Acidimicrobiales bacterium]